VYRFINKEDTILYVGKAKDLKSRLSSYFGQRKDRVRKTKVMVKNAHRIEFTVVDTEADALLLEATLIKKHQPRYNVALKDGKTYTYLVIKKERFPRVFLTRRAVKNHFKEEMLSLAENMEFEKAAQIKDKLTAFDNYQGKSTMVSPTLRDLDILPAERILRTLQSDLQMDSLPLHIECFDNSNMQGSFPVASCVVFKNAKPSKKDYRHFNIKTVEGPDDFASMTEVVHRRYRRLLDEDQPLPQLIIIDGGKGQVSSALKSLKVLGLENKITMIGVAKRLEEIFFPEDSIPLYINKKSESLKLIQQLRNEAHRFAITFHRLKRSQNFTSTELTNISGIGEKTAAKLLQEFGSVKKVKLATHADLETVIGRANASKVRDYFNRKEGE